MNLEENIQKLINLIKKFLSTYPLLKTILVSFMGILGGSSFVAFINKYAVYNYMISYGGRLPVESIPYLDIAVSLLSFAIFTVFFSCAFLLYGLLILLVNLSVNKSMKVKNEPITTKDSQVLALSMFELMTVKSVLEIKLSTLENIVIVLRKFQRHFSQHLSAFIMVVISIFILLSFILLVISLTPSSEHVLVFFTIIQGENHSFFITSLLVIYGIVTSLLLLIILVSLIKPFIKHFVFSLSVLLTLLIIGNLFNVNNYAAFLREIQYGGGVAVTIVRVKEKGKEKLVEESLDGYLILVTETQTIIWDDSKSEFIEVPVSAINLVKTKGSIDYKLPEPKGSILDVFKHLLY
ncbi:hypothetical protein [Candidatus Albibeggiatoa sp. nov. NOAA]|uniref:hypothetical protein n=1 Tax=Candidatus Albibeggiatoa sp. nov. NOAA TaxID=3162724 RepID=UPI0032F38202|nr:hypothetical protein [Thiotrichaceae bacterium]